MTFIRFPSSLKDHIQSSILWFNPSIKVSFTEFIDPKTNTLMVDMEYSNEDLNEKQANDVHAMIKRSTIDLQEKSIHMFRFTLTHTCDFGWFRPSKGDQEIVKIGTPFRQLVVFKTPEGDVKIGDA